MKKINLTKIVFTLLSTTFVAPIAFSNISNLTNHQINRTNPTETKNFILDIELQDQHLTIFNQHLSSSLNNFGTYIESYNSQFISGHNLFIFKTFGTLGHMVTGCYDNIYLHEYIMQDSTHYWELLVNNKVATKGCDGTPLNNNKTYTWRYISE